MLALMCACTHMCMFCMLTCVCKHACVRVHTGACILYRCQHMHVLCAHTGGCTHACMYTHVHAPCMRVNVYVLHADTHNACMTVRPYMGMHFACSRVYVHTCVKCEHTCMFCVLTHEQGCLCVCLTTCACAHPSSGTRQKAPNPCVYMLAVCMTNLHACPLAHVLSTGRHGQSSLLVSKLVCGAPEETVMSIGPQGRMLFPWGSAVRRAATRQGCEYLWGRHCSARRAHAWCPAAQHQP